MPPRLLLATNNKGKVKEYQSLLRNTGYELVTPVQQGVSLAVEEVGETLEENAKLKALAFARAGNLLALADDSGLEVDVLDGAPGRFSARYAGEGASDKDRVNYLLSKLKDVPWEKRTAQFRCAIAVAYPAGQMELCSGVCPGFIAFAPKGELGFGYDPVFYLPEFDKTMAELPLATKNRISHRGKAARKAREILKKLLASGQGGI